VAEFVFDNFLTPAHRGDESEESEPRTEQ
jgi:hypothetical protein